MRFVALFALLTACSGDDTETSDEPSCADCADGEYCLVYFEEDGTREECAALPETCAGDDSCDCRGDMYDGCEDPFVGVGCSDTLAPTQISCND